MTTATEKQQPHRLLVVDDSPIARMLISKYLLRQGVEGLEVLEAGDGEQALELAAAHGPTAVICDLNMPGISGLDLIRSLRQRGVDVPMGIISSTATEASQREAEDAGADFFMRKPLDFKDLDQVLSEKAGIGRPPGKSKLFEQPEEMMQWMVDALLVVSDIQPHLKLKPVEKMSIFYSEDAKPTLLTCASIDIGHGGASRTMGLALSWNQAEQLARAVWGTRPGTAPNKDQVHDVTGELLNMMMAVVANRGDASLGSMGVEDRKITLSLPRHQLGKECWYQLGRSKTFKQRFISPLFDLCMYLYFR